MVIPICQRPFLFRPIGERGLRPIHTIQWIGLMGETNTSFVFLFVENGTHRRYSNLVIRVFLLGSNYRPRTCLSNLPKGGFLHRTFFFFIKVQMRVHVVTTMLPRRCVRIRNRVHKVFRPCFFLRHLLYHRLHPLYLLFFGKEGQLLSHRSFSNGTSGLLQIFGLLPMFLRRIHKGNYGVFLPRTGSRRIPNGGVVSIPVFVVRHPIWKRPRRFSFVITSRHGQVLVKVGQLGGPTSYHLRKIRPTFGLYLMKYFPQLGRRRLRGYVSSFFLFTTFNSTPTFSYGFTTSDFPDARNFSSFSNMRVPPSRASTTIYSSLANSYPSAM